MSKSGANAQVSFGFDCVTALKKAAGGKWLDRVLRDLEAPVVRRRASSRKTNPEMVDLIGIKPTTSSLRTKRSIN
jgi:hypothetical protein